MLRGRGRLASGHRARAIFPAAAEASRKYQRQEGQSRTNVTRAGRPQNGGNYSHENDIARRTGDSSSFFVVVGRNKKKK
jgi:hypothetical protein